MSTSPNFSPYPFDRLPRMSRVQARLESVVARWLAAAPSGSRLTELVGAPRARVVAPASQLDPFAAVCIVHTNGLSIECRAASTGIRAIARQLLGGPDELPAPRPLMLVEQSLWSHVVATALEDLGIAAKVWPAGGPRTPTAAAAPGSATIALDVQLGTISLAVELALPAGLELRVPPPRAIPAWADRLHLDVPLVVGRCAVARETLARLSPRTLVTVEAPSTGLELEILGGTVGLRAAAKALGAEVVTGYLPRDMTLPDAAHVELTVALGTTQLSLRQVFELSIGQIISLGRPLAGPFELRAAGKIVGKGELVDVDGELAVRIVSLGDQE